MVRRNAARYLSLRRDYATEFEPGYGRWEMTYEK